MPVTKAAAKALRHSNSRNVVNMKIRVKTRTAIKQAREAIKNGKQKEAAEAVAAAIKQLDRAYARGTYKLNTISRTKSRLTSALAKVGTKK